MTTSCNCPNDIEKVGADPINLNWCLVRGDTATLRVQFFQPDESTAYNTSTWTYSSSAYDTSSGLSYTLITSPGIGYVDITALSTTTANWGIGFGSVVGKLSFDLEVTIENGAIDTIWTPVIGVITVLGDINGGL